MRFLKIIFLISMGLVVPRILVAHTGTEVPNGWLHPLSGVDHVLATLAVGLWAVRINGIAKFVVPGVFLICMGLAGQMGFLFNIDMDMTESLIVISVGVLSLLLLTGVKPPVAITLIPAAFLGLFQGQDHTVEASGNVSGVGFGTEFWLMTLVLLVLAVYFGMRMQKWGTRLFSVFCAGLGFFWLAIY